MKYLTVSAVGAALLVGSALAAQDEKAKDKAEPALSDVMQKASYGLGVVTAKNYKLNSINIDADLFVKGFKDAMSGGKVALNDLQIQEALQTLQRDLMARQAGAKKDMAGLAARQKMQGDAFLAANKAKPGVKTLPSGLQYKVIAEGSGKSPTADDKVKVNYRGTFINGTVFDSSEKHAAQPPFRLKGLIPGWVEALQLMKVGSKWQLFIPPELAYGAEPRQPGIPPNATLIFNVELVGIE